MEHKYIRPGVEIQVKKNSGVIGEGTRGVILSAFYDVKSKLLQGSILWEDQLDSPSTVSNFDEYCIELSSKYNRLVKLSDFKSITDLIGLEVYPSIFSRSPHLSVGKIFRVTSRSTSTNKLVTVVYAKQSSYVDSELDEEYEYELETDYPLYYTTDCYHEKVLKTTNVTRKSVEDKVNDLETFIESL